MTRQSTDEAVEVVVRFRASGAVEPVQVTWRNGRKKVIEVGRSWRDTDPMPVTHVLVRLTDETSLELRFDPSTLRWSARPVGPETLPA